MQGNATGQFSESLCYEVGLVGYASSHNPGLKLYFISSSKLESNLYFVLSHEFEPEIYCASSRELGLCLTLSQVMSSGWRPIMLQVIN